MTLHDLEELLEDNDVAHFDPVYEAFKLFAGDGAGGAGPGAGPGAGAGDVGGGAGGGGMAGAVGAGPETDGQGELTLSISSARLREVFSAYGLGELSEEEYRVLSRSADVDGDGRVTLADFRAMLSLADKCVEGH